MAAVMPCKMRVLCLVSTFKACLLQTCRGLLPLRQISLNLAFSWQGVYFLISFCLFTLSDISFSIQTKIINCSPSIRNITASFALFTATAQLFLIIQKMFNYMGCSQQMVEQGVKQFGLAVGARKMIDSEYEHAAESIQSGVYITYWNEAKKSECSRLGKLSKCFCGHQLPNHNSQFFGKKFNTACQKCPCKRFMFVPSRPEECGMYWLVRRKDFDVAAWRPPCKCKHICEEHNPSYPLRCKKCPCPDFNSNFACLTCDGAWQSHEVLYEMSEDRQLLGKKVGEEYLPLSTHKEVQKEVFNKEKYAMIKGKSVPPKREQQQKEEISSKLNPKRPTKAEQAKLKSPFGFIMQPKYPDFMKK